MSSRHKTPKRKKRKVLIFGENENDTKTLAELIRALRPDATWTVEHMRRPPVLIKDAGQNAIPSRVSIIVKLIKAAQVDAEVVAVFAHEDCDDVEPAHETLTKKIEDAFSSAPAPVLAATPAWETETWFFQWPDAVADAFPAWTYLGSYKGRNVGLISNSKEEFRRAVRAKDKRRDYRESDAPTIALAVRNGGYTRNPLAQSASFDVFVSRADSLSA